MNILIIGTGNTGRGIATRALAGQHAVTLYDEDVSKAQTLATEFLKSSGLNAIDAGALDRARQLEALGFLGIQLQFSLNTGFGTAWKLVLPAAA